jgi:hypothetical protein
MKARILVVANRTAHSPELIAALRQRSLASFTRSSWRLRTASLGPLT